MCVLAPTSPRPGPNMVEGEFAFTEADFRKISAMVHGDAGIHLAGAAAFLLLGLHRAPGVRPRGGLLGNGWILGGVCIAAFFALSNRMANLTDMRPNEEFYLLGRLPKEAKPR